MYINRIRELAMTSTQGERLSALVFAANAITDETLAGFGDITAQQLNWKPGAEQWSVAQCFDHLVTANEAFFPIFEKVLSGKKENKADRKSTRLNSSHPSLSRMPSSA